MKTLLESDPEIKKAHDIYEEFSANSQFREVYEGRLDYEQKKAREEGLKK